LTVISFVPRPQLMMKPKLRPSRAVYLMICEQLVVDWTNTMLHRHLLRRRCRRSKER
jgi:hypothetical protein